MPAAVPRYLRETGAAAPGHRFGLYFDAWDDNWQLPNNKSQALHRIAGNLPADTRRQLAALVARQAFHAEQLGEDLLALPMLAAAPFATGLGNEHPLENGFAFLAPYGLPYLAGSGVKGAVRRAAEELASGEWGDNAGWSEEKIRHLFGPGEKDQTKDDNALQGALRFWDVFPEPAKDTLPLLAVEIMTPHHSDYYQQAKTPHHSESPTPITFLAVAAGVRFLFHVECRPARLPEALRGEWRALLAAAFAHAGEWCGFGAKTAVGYGRMATDRKKLAAQEEDKQQKAAAAALAALTPNQRRITEFEAACAARAEQLRGGKDNPNTALHQKARDLARAAHEEGGWSAAEKRAAAATIETLLPQVVKVDIKDERKKLKLAALREAGD